MQIIDALRTAMAAEIPTDVGATGFARMYDATLTTKIATMSLSNPAFTAGAAGVQSLDVTPIPTDSGPGETKDSRKSPQKCVIGTLSPTAVTMPLQNSKKSGN